MPDSERPAATQKQESILIYEDDAACGAAFATIWRHAGYDVRLTNHFRPALDALGGYAPVDMLLADIFMPGGLNGVALARMARMRNPGIKIIYVTGYDVPVLQLRLLGPLLRKPVSKELLLEVVGAALRSANI